MRKRASQLPAEDSRSRLYYFAERTAVSQKSDTETVIRPQVAYKIPQKYSGDLQSLGAFRQTLAVNGLGSVRIFNIASRDSSIFPTIMLLPSFCRLKPQWRFAEHSPAID